MNRSLYPQAQRIIEREFNVAKKKLIESFENAPPSLALTEVAEMDRSERGENEDGFVEKGNLYTFLGFEDDRNPVQEVSDVLAYGIELESLSMGAINRKGIYVITGKVSIPTLGEINEQSQLPWITRGWIDALTNGIRGLPNFLFGDFSDKAYSLSGGGLEAKTRGKNGGRLVNTGRGEFKPYSGKYLYYFIEKFKDKLRG